VGVGSSVMGIRFPHGMDHHHHRLGRSAGGWIRMETTPPVGAAMVRRSAQRSMPRGISRRLTPRVRSCARGLEPHTTPTLLLLWSAVISSDISLPNSLGTIRRAASIGLSGVSLRAVYRGSGQRTIPALCGHVYLLVGALSHSSRWRAVRYPRIAPGPRRRPLPRSRRQQEDRCDRCGGLACDRRHRGGAARLLR
jgi:hypothetical protein